MTNSESARTDDPVQDGGRREGVGREGTATTVDALALAAAPNPDHPRGRPSVKRLMQEDGANLVTFTFAPGQTFPDHSVAHPITVQCLSGELTFGCGDETTQMTPGVVVHCKERVTHRVDCPESAPASSVLLLTMLTGERV
ncbi:cupin domain-containing protein [Brevibacterium yomogidense]|uniref:cupin domain-containing protein n=1 Tax=Brevibacterium yomogidense TaxID=946573 RepID=UPI002FCCD72C